jgi:hypothetical protein
LNIYISKSFGFNPDKANKNTPKQRLHFGVNINDVFNINNKGVPIGNLSSPYFLESVNRGTEGNYNFSHPRRLTFNTSFSF